MRNCSLVAVILLVSLSSCSLSRANSPIEAADALHLSLFTAKQFAGGTEYERYQLVGDSLWRECGLVQKHRITAASEPLEGDHIFEKDPSLQVLERRRETLAANTIDSLSSKVQQLAQLSVSQRKSPPPGALFSLSAKGIFELEASVNRRSAQLMTSIDAVSAAKDEVTQTGRALFEELRNLGPEPCGSRSFFGIGPAQVAS